MNTYMLRIQTSYGEVVHIVNAESEDDVRDIARTDDTIRLGHDIEFIDTKTHGIVNSGGGDDY